jgi:hypothetical protein
MTDAKTPRNWPRTQRFVLSPAGSEAEAEYRSCIVASRTEQGRAAYDAAHFWRAAEYALQPDDALYLGEARTGPISIAEVVDSLDSCGKTKRDALFAIERLVERGFVTPIASS